MPSLKLIRPFYNICDQAVSLNKHFQVTKHLSIVKHESILTKQENFKKIFIKDSYKDQNIEFSFDLCRAFSAFDIPLWK